LIPNPPQVTSTVTPSNVSILSEARKSPGVSPAQMLEYEAEQAENHKWMAENHPPISRKKRAVRFAIGQAPAKNVKPRLLASKPKRSKTTKAHLARNVSDPKASVAAATYLASLNLNQAKQKSSELSSPTVERKELAIAGYYKKIKKFMGNHSFLSASKETGEGGGTHAMFTKASFSLLLAKVKAIGALTEDLVFYDFGSGTMINLIHTALEFNCKVVGIEIEKDRYKSALAEYVEFMGKNKDSLPAGLYNVACFWADFEKVGTLAPGLLYSFDSAFGPSQLHKIVLVYLNSPCEWFICFRDGNGHKSDAKVWIAEALTLGIVVKEITQVSMCLAGAGGSRTAVIYRKSSVVNPAQLPVCPGQTMSLVGIDALSLLFDGFFGLSPESRIFYYEALLAKLIPSTGVSLRSDKQ
jgi:hypothetical protein